MAKVYIKRKKLNEDVAINDPTLAQQYLVVKKQIGDKQTKRDQLLRNANQIDNEINILQKNLLAIETKAVGQSADKVQQQMQQQDQKAQQTQTTSNTNQTQEVQESLESTLTPKKDIPTIDEYRELVISAIDEEYIDGETLAFEHDHVVQRCFDNFEDPKYCAGLIIDYDRDIGNDMEEGFIGGDVANMNMAMKTQPIRVRESMDEEIDESLDIDTEMPVKDRFSVYDVISIDGDEKIIIEVDKYQNDSIITFDDDTSLNASEMEREGIEFIRHLSSEEIDEIEYDEEEETARQEREDELYDKAKELEDELDYLKREEKDINWEMEETVSYPEEEHPVLKPKHPDEIANVFGSRLQENEEKQNEILKQLKIIYNDENFPFYAKMRYYTETESIDEGEVNESEKAWDTVSVNLDDTEEGDFELITKWNNVGRIKIEDDLVYFIPNDTEVIELLSKYMIEPGLTDPRVNESVYDDMVNSIDIEIEKLTDIKDYISQYTDEEEAEVLLPVEVEEEPVPEEPEEIHIGEPEEEIEPEVDLVEVPEYMPVEDEDIADEVVPSEDKFDRFVPSEEERIVDETLKVEEDKIPYKEISEELEEDEENLEMLNYDIEDEPEDEYVFHIRIDGESENEIIAKIYKDNPEDYWTVRVVKGDEEPLESMKFDPELDKLDIIGYLADMYADIEIVNPKEYEYLLDDKEKVDSEYYEELIDKE